MDQPPDNSPTDHSAALADLEDLYHRVLELTREQETCLRQGSVTALPEILVRKTTALARAQELTASIMAAGETPGFQAALDRIGAILAQTVSAEDRCQALVPKPSAPPNRRRALAAYGSPPPKR